MIRVHRSFYESAGRPVPFFLRAYDSLLLLGVTEKRARVLVQRTDSTVLMGVAIYTYRRRAEVRNPPAYIETLIRSLEPQTAPEPSRDKSQAEGKS